MVQRCTKQEFLVDQSSLGIWTCGSIHRLKYRGWSLNTLKCFHWSLICWSRQGTQLVLNRTGGLVADGQLVRCSLVPYHRVFFPYRTYLSGVCQEFAYWHQRTRYVIGHQSCFHMTQPVPMPLLHQDIFSLGPFLLFTGCAKFISWWAARDTKYVSDLIMSCLSNWSMCSAKLFQNHFFIDRRRKDLVVLIQDPRMHQCREIVQESSHQEDTHIHRQKMIQWVKINQKETHSQVHHGSKREGTRFQSFFPST